MLLSLRLSILFTVLLVLIAQARADDKPAQAPASAPAPGTKPPAPHPKPPAPQPKPPAPQPKPPAPQPKPPATEPKPPAPQPKPQNQTQPQPLDCDKAGDDDLTIYGTAKSWETSDDPVYYLSPGMSFCEEVYTDQSNVVCVSSGHFPKNNPHKSCSEWVQVTNKASGVVSFGRILDQCGDVPNSTFGCNDIFLSKQMFEELAGKDEEGALNAGHLDQVEWRKVVSPCFGLYAGLPGKYPNGTIDPGFGEDSNGFLRCGRKTGDDRLVGPDIAKVCNHDIKDCKQADQIRKTLPPYQGGQGNKSAEKQPHAVAYNTENLSLISHD
ncbi:uncharacterized protein FA14DRAFT_185181 [Meira miltonrushii]|uniref:Uncharacterized protein n=1 Tax=Meira miltonrushii TaxID=1280837 RepID=A0A316V7A8_9BASI|nr:uncharacterized protein FA14DRAFT_185181 [Meira miltonrushii]PWN33406.1 hypothetical protein FA14DRAFT_185181 [Meira miltonrushii]